MSDTSKSIRGFTVLLVLVLGFLVSPVLADNAAVESDPEFGGQILTLTEPKPEIPKSTNPRYKENPDKTVLDLEAKLVWAQQDSYQKLKQWLNWHDAQKYVQKMNEEKFGGFSTWRLPTKKEIGSLFDENVSVAWNYYWTKNEVHVDPIFGDSHCCYWTSEEYKNDMAWGFNFIRGKPYLTRKGGIQKSLTVIRPVRDMTAEEKKLASHYVSTAKDRTAHHEKEEPAE